MLVEVPFENKEPMMFKMRMLIFSRSTLKETVKKLFRQKEDDHKWKHISNAGINKEHQKG